ncbi:MAG: hypothetical protein ACOCZV_02700 [Nanoarchaeota archaeon]
MCSVKGCRAASRLSLIILIVLLVLALSTAVYFYISAMQAKADEKRSEQQLDETSRQLANLEDSYQSLNRSHHELETNHSELLDKYNNLTDKNEELLEKVETSISTIKYFNEEIDRAMNWFSENSDLDSSSLRSSNRDMLKRKCFSIEDDSCTIKAGCPALFIKENLDLHYRDDFDAHWESDKLLSLAEFIEYYGGDCEDYSLFVKAIFNEFLATCDHKDKEIHVESFVSGQGDDKYFLDKGENWYSDDAMLADFTGYRYPTVVCGSLLDPNTGERSGHCINALSTKPIRTIDDLDRLYDAILIESQTGEYRGEIEQYEYESITSHRLTTTLGGSIHYIITDKDQFIFSEEFGKWMSYTSINETLSPVTRELEDTLESYGIDPRSIDTAEDPFKKEQAELEGESKTLCFYDQFNKSIPLRKVNYYPKSGKTLIDQKHDAYTYDKIALDETSDAHCASIATDAIDSVGKMSVLVDDANDSVVTDIILYKEDLVGVSRFNITLLSVGY